MNEDELVKQCLYQLELLLQQQTAPKDTAAIIIEPVLGEGGYVPAPASFLRGLRGPRTYRNRRGFPRRPTRGWG